MKYYRPAVSLYFGVDNDNRSEETEIKSLRTYLFERVPEYIQMVPNHWLDQEEPLPGLQFYISIIFLMICISGNISQILVMIAFCR